MESPKAAVPDLKGWAMEQVTGAGIGTLVVLGYLLLVEALAAAIVVLAQFIVLQVRTLRTLAVVEPKPALRRRSSLCQNHKSRPTGLAAV
jgi:hypothetical protein